MKSSVIYKSALIVSWVQIERDRSKSGPSRPRAQVDDDDDEETEQDSNSTESYYEPHAKRLKLVSDMPEEQFNNEYMFVH